MGKTWRRIPGAFNDDGTPNYQRRSDQPERITPEWALARLEQRIECWVDDMISRGVINSSCRDDVLREMENRVCKAVSLYNSDRKGKHGERVAATTYLRAAFENTSHNLIRDMGRQCRAAVEVPIENTSREDAEASGGISVEDARFSDGCRTVDTLFLRMDVAALMASLPEAGRVYLRMQYRGFTLDETAEALGISRRTLCRRIAPVVELSARLCGFFSQEDRRLGKDREELYRKGGELRPQWAK